MRVNHLVTSNLPWGPQLTLWSFFGQFVLAKTPFFRELIHKNKLVNCYHYTITSLVS